MGKLDDYIGLLQEIKDFGDGCSKEDSFYLCNEMKTFSGVRKISTLNTQDSMLKDKYPQFVEWINKIGKQLNPYFVYPDCAWACSNKERIEYLNQYIKQLKDGRV